MPSINRADWGREEGRKGIRRRESVTSVNIPIYTYICRLIFFSSFSFSCVSCTRESSSSRRRSRLSAEFVQVSVLLYKRERERERERTSSKKTQKREGSSTPTDMRLVTLSLALMGLVLAEPNDQACPTVTKELLPSSCARRCNNPDCVFVSTVNNPCNCPDAVPTATLIHPCGSDVGFFFPGERRGNPSLCFLFFFFFFFFFLSTHTSL